MVKKLLNWIRKLDSLEITIESNNNCNTLLNYKYFNKFKITKQSNKFATINNQTLTLHKIIDVGIPIKTYYTCSL